MTSAQPYEPPYEHWVRLGFRPTTSLVRKRRRPDGLLDVLFLQTNGAYSAWIAEPETIWLVVRELRTWDPLQDEDDLLNLIKQFPPLSLR